MVYRSVPLRNSCTYITTCRKPTCCSSGRGGGAALKHVSFVRAAVLTPALLVVSHPAPKPCFCFLGLVLCWLLWWPMPMVAERGARSCARSANDVKMPPIPLGETRKRMTSMVYFHPSRCFPQACFSLPCFCRATFPAPCAWWYALLFWLLPRGLGCGGSGGLKHRGRGGTARLVLIFSRVSVSLGNTGK